MSDSQSADFGPLVSREQAGNAIGSAMRLFVGRGRRYSVKQLSNATGIKDRVIECVMCRVDNPDYRPLSDFALLSVAKFLGADFTNEWLHLAEQGAFNTSDDDPDPGTIAIESTEDSAAVVRAAMDGEFDDHERPDLRVIGARKIRRGRQLIALGRKAA